jgi:spermidine synthase
MTDLGSLIYRTADDEGEIHVYEDRRFRYLTFGNAVEQSCLNLARPARLEYAYTQAMLLPLVFGRDVRRLLLLGTGGGSLARAMRAADRGFRVLGVDRRQAVLDVARAYFHLPDDRHFEAVCQDADDFLQSHEGLHDLIFADLYLAEGMYPGQIADGFLRLCRERLTEDGVLVVNQWASEFQTSRAAFIALTEVFDGQVLHLHVQGGNIIAFAFRGNLPDLQRDRLFAAAQALGLRLDIPLQRHARNLWRQNAELLGVGRFNRRRVR